ncbi:MAG: ATP-binding protein, partial [Pseudomonadota bacterium]|nr:ATP-binding protein [Pseudomonadota bacterium]
PEPFEACALVESVALAAREAAKSKGLHLSVELPPSIFFVLADGSRIDQVLTNLVVNSVRYTDAGEVRIVLYPFDEVRKCLRFSVKDTGPGLPPAVLPSLFEPDKLLSGTERKGEGSGIGLAVVRTLVKNLGGVISVSSQSGEGTTFNLAVPAEPIDADTSVTRQILNPDRILIVDDREDVLTGLTSVINELGYECDRASSATIAENFMAARRYSAVLLDIQMPIKNGAELAEETRRGRGPNRSVRLLGMSAAEVTAQYRNGPFDACLTKPIDRNALISALRGEWPETRRST